jgi:hypothetical protein
VLDVGHQFVRGQRRFARHQEQVGDAHDGYARPVVGATGAAAAFFTDVMCEFTATAVGLKNAVPK